MLNKEEDEKLDSPLPSERAMYFDIYGATGATQIREVDLIWEEFSEDPSSHNDEAGK